MFRAAVAPSVIQCQAANTHFAAIREGLRVGLQTASILNKKKRDLANRYLDSTLEEKVWDRQPGKNR